MHRVSPLFVTLLCGTLSFMACDTDEGGEGPVVLSTGLPANTALGDLTATDAEAICDATLAMAEEAAAASVMTDPCIGEGLTAKFAGDQQVATCEAAVEACRAEQAENWEESSEPDVTSECDPEAMLEDLADCTATVAEFEACANAMLAKLHEITSVYNCEMSMEQAMSMAEEGGDLSPPECDVVETDECQVGSDDETSREELPPPPEELP